MRRGMKGEWNTRVVQFEENNRRQIRCDESGATRHVEFLAIYPLCTFKAYRNMFSLILQQI